MQDKEKIKKLQKELKKYKKTRTVTIKIKFNRDMFSKDFSGHDIANCNPKDKNHYEIVVFAMGWLKLLGHEFGHVLEFLLAEEDADFYKLHGHGELAYLFEDAIELWQRKKLEEKNK